MTLRKNMGLMVAGAAALVLAGVAGFMLFKFRTVYQEVKHQLQSAQQRLDALHRRDPYPSDENVRLMETNFTVLDGYFDELFASLRKGQIEPVQMEPAEFPLLLEKTVRKLVSQARGANVELPVRFAFGFERYAMGELPEQQDVPRLVLQLKTIERFCEILFDARVTSILSVDRETFERGAVQDGRGGAEGRGRRSRSSYDAPPEEEDEAASKEWTDPSGLFAKEHYVLTFMCRDSAIWQALNYLASRRMLTVVSDIRMANEQPLPKPEAEARQPIPTFAESPLRAAAPAKPKEMLTHEERVVAGREEIKVVLGVDAYRLLGPEEKEAAQ